MYIYIYIYTLYTHITNLHTLHMYTCRPDAHGGPLTEVTELVPPNSSGVDVIPSGFCAIYYVIRIALGVSSTVPGIVLGRILYPGM